MCCGTEDRKIRRKEVKIITPKTNVLTTITSVNRYATLLDDLQEEAENWSMDNDDEDSSEEGEKKTKKKKNPKARIFKTLLDKADEDDARIIMADSLLKEEKINDPTMAKLIACADKFELRDDYIKVIKSKDIKMRETAIQTESNEASTQCNIEDSKDALFTMPNRKAINAVMKHKKYIKADEELTYWLKSKYFMKGRTHATLSMMVNDARVWMLKQKNGDKDKYTLQSYEDYFVMTRAIMSSFIIDDEELAFRALMKNPQQLDAQQHMLSLFNGDLGWTAAKNPGKNPIKTELVDRDLLRKQPIGPMSGLVA
jgi:hypothetical protein